jgi:hypothetical protein
MLSPAVTDDQGGNMKKKLVAGFAMTLFMLGTGGFARATPLSLDYSVTDIGGGRYNYEFELVLDNNDGSWSAGQGWRWFVFGDQYCAPSPLTNFIGDYTDLPIGPWTNFSTSSGGHNGPTLGYVLDYWVPTSIGDTLSWSGTSTANLAQGELLFSTIAGTLNSGVAADLEVANRLDPVPEPATMFLFGTGIAGLAGTRLNRRKKRK